MESERYFAGDITIILADGSRVPAKVTADEIYAEGKEICRISLEQGTEVRVAESEEDFFDALKRLRLDLEKTGALLHCFGASENVIPLECRDRWVQQFWLTRCASAPQLHARTLSTSSKPMKRLFHLQWSNRSAFFGDG